MSWLALLYLYLLIDPSGHTFGFGSHLLKCALVFHSINQSGGEREEKRREENENGWSPAMLSRQLLAI